MTERRRKDKAEHLPRRLQFDLADLAHQNFYTIDSWCKRQNLSRAAYYRLKRQGLAPEVTMIAGLRRISKEAEERWLRRMQERRA